LPRFVIWIRVFGRDPREHVARVVGQRILGRAQELAAASHSADHPTLVVTR
jgi:hypothetical protein